jgi:hypothetical protein
MAIITDKTVVIEHMQNGAVLLHSPEFSELRAAGRVHYESDVHLAYVDDDKHNKHVDGLWVDPKLFNQLLTEELITEKVTFGDVVVPGDFVLTEKGRKHGFR